MGNRSYLYLKNPKRENYLFEANNALPFFWVTFLDKNIIEQNKQDWKKLVEFEKNHSEEEAEDYLEKKSPSFKIDLPTFEKNVNRSRVFLRKNYPSVFPLYSDFVDFIKSKFETDDYLELNIWEFFGFYNSEDELFQELENEINAIETDKAGELRFLIVEDLIGQGTGFDMTTDGEFSKLESYQKTLDKRYIPKIKEEQKFSKKSLIISIVILLICPLFSIYVIKTFPKDGFSAQLVVTAIANIGFYIFAIWSIFGEIKAYKISK
ncbi:hypothetical protein [Soonwooa sp.]|uniref:hypothetical protein n=1 Tax=Soonwooa sp. TaxID=1938592 RepID=UPI0026040014|nr:hypothetical protein [Soonwooa sp.]